MVYPALNTKPLPDTANSQWMHLNIDVTRETADPKFWENVLASGGPVSPEFMDHLSDLDGVASNIADFTEHTRDTLQPVWVYSRYEQMETHEDLGNFFQNQGEPHRVERFENDPVLEKTHRSAVPENIDFFNDLKSQGVKGFVVTGLYTNDCVLKTVQDLQEIGFQIIVPHDLIDSAKPSARAEGMNLLRETGATLSSKSAVLESVKGPGSLPQAVEKVSHNLQEAGRISSWMKTIGRGGAMLTKALGPLGKVLLPIAIAGVGLEVTSLNNTAEAAIANGQMPAEALAAYQAVLALHSAQSVGDPTGVGGELAVQLAYDKFVEQYGVTGALKEQLEPGSLLETVGKWTGIIEHNDAISPIAVSKDNNDPVLYGGIKTATNLDQHFFEASTGESGQNPQTRTMLHQPDPNQKLDFSS